MDIKNKYYKLSIQDIEKIFLYLKQEYKIIGNKIENNSVILAELENLSDTPSGYSDEQSPGKYKLINNKSEQLFSFSLSPQSWKKYLHPPESTLWKIHKKDNSFNIETPKIEKNKMAFWGIRPCDFEAIKIYDGVFLRDNKTNLKYKSIRDNLFIFAINCTVNHNTCFCSSMNSGPDIKDGFDLAVTEIFIENDENNTSHHFILNADTQKGQNIVDKFQFKEASKEEVNFAKNKVIENKESITNTFNTKNLDKILQDNYNHEIWYKMGEKCTSCSNCTFVCPTCYCTRTVDFTNLDGSMATRISKWDSCFSKDFTRINNKYIRDSLSSRYRHWVMHKFSTWQEQFGTQGCTGCGRCITWCPSGINIVKVIREIQASSKTDYEDLKVEQ